MSNSNEKVKCLIYGVALGDAFGMATEMLSREKILELNLDFEKPFDSLDISVI